MMRTRNVMALALALAATSALVGCSSPPAEESKPMKAGDGSQTPVATGASSAAPAAAAAPSNRTDAK